MNSETVLLVCVIIGIPISIFLGLALVLVVPKKYGGIRATEDDNMTSTSHDNMTSISHDNKTNSSGSPDLLLRKYAFDSKELLKKYPYIVSVFDANSSVSELACSGIILNENYLLSGACWSKYPKSGFKARAGSTYWSKGGTVHNLALSGSSVIEKYVVFKVMPKFDLQKVKPFEVHKKSKNITLLDNETVMTFVGWSNFTGSVTDPNQQFIEKKVLWKDLVFTAANKCKNEHKSTGSIIVYENLVYFFNPGYTTKPSTQFAKHYMCGNIFLTDAVMNKLKRYKY